MEDKELINLWKAYDKKLEENLSLNKKNAEDITKLKVQSFLSSMKPLKVFTILVGIVWVAFIDGVIFVAYQAGGIFLLISALIQVILTKVAIGIYVYQLILINNVDINDSVLATQGKIARLKSTTIWIARLLFLQIPVWNTFYWTEGLWANANIWVYLIQIPLTAAFTYLAIWLFINISYENRNKKWFQWIFNGKEWTPVIKSMEMLQQIETYKN
ncbi:hypothetical protein [Emticicia sp. C21]|uniref:hypothetical protein n=1 Tax=Emticicia sp. C21 TaxID=2302915 RepID=UPI000E34F1E4|nr:hypothetical protein [Emticicia sp. C21]RFS16838.1 hypothetical protein D0T08_09160 [Emticicia sp. C21]